MATVAVRTTAVRDEAGVCRARTRVTGRRRTIRQPYNYLMLVKRVLSALMIAFLLGYVNVYANLATTGHSRSRLTAAYERELRRNEQLKVEFKSLSSPHNVVMAAQKGGMVYATQYDYIRGPLNVASAQR